MSISRRQFILGTAAGLILPSYYDKVLAYWENHGEPLIEVPKTTKIELIAIDKCGWGLELNWGDPLSEPPEMTVREFARRYCGSEEDYILLWGPDPDIDFDAPMDWDLGFDTWARCDSPNAAAFGLLAGLDLGPELLDRGPVEDLRFIDGYCPGNDYLAVEVGNEISLSLLQKRLNELDTGISLRFVGSY